MRAKFALRLLLLIWHQSYHTLVLTQLSGRHRFVFAIGIMERAEIQKRESFPEKLCRFWPFYHIRPPKVLLSSIKSKKKWCVKPKGKDHFPKNLRLLGKFFIVNQGVIFYIYNLHRSNISNSFHTDEKLESCSEIMVLINSGYNFLRLVRATTSKGTKIQTWNINYHCYFICLI